MRCDHCLTTPCVAVTTASISPPAGSASVVWQVNALPGVAASRATRQVTSADTSRAGRASKRCTSALIR